MISAKQQESEAELGFELYSRRLYDFVVVRTLFVALCCVIEARTVNWFDPGVVEQEKNMR
jgi:hypothetical protein